MWLAPHTTTTTLGVTFFNMMIPKLQFRFKRNSMRSRMHKVEITYIVNIGI